MPKLGLISTVSYKTLTYKHAIDEWRFNNETITLGCFLLYPDTVKTGWVYFAPGEAPDWQWDALVGNAGKPPSSEHKRCFSVDVQTEEQGVMTWSGAGYGQCAALEALFDQTSASEGDNPGKVPVVKYTGSEVRKVGKGHTRIPKFEIVAWVDPAFPPWTLQSVTNGAPF